jgi:hypothetical protein
MWHEARRVDLVGRAIAMPHDVVEFHGLAKTGRLIQIASLGPQMRVLDQRSHIALEMAVIDGVEAHQGVEQANFALGDLIALEIALVRKTIFSKHKQ